MVMKQYRIMKLFILILLISFYTAGCMEQTQNVSVVMNNSALPEFSPVVDIAKKDLSERLEIPVENISFVRQETVDWPDASLGFPKEGMIYAQVITPGYIIILEAEDKLYEYHSDYKRVAGPKEI